MRYIKLLSTSFFLFFLCNCYAQSFIGTLEKNISKYYQKDGSIYSTLDSIIATLEQDPDAVDMVTKEVYQKMELLPDQVDQLMLTFNLNTGKWSDLNYDDSRESAWDPKIHTERILLLTGLYTNRQSIYYKQQKLNMLLHRALKFWFDANLTCKNWWYNEIGVPKTLGPVFIMLRDELTADEIKKGILVLNRSTIKMTGQNKVWLAGNVLFKAILTRDESLARLARDTIFSELKVSGSEGIQADNSFHQHGPQQQFGNYGLSFVNTLSFWARVCYDTPLEIDNDRLSLLRDLMLEGYSWITWKGYFDINSLGRHFFKGVDKSKTLGAAYSMLDMSIVDPQHSTQYENFIQRNYSESYLPKLTGTKHFWRSDMTVYRSTNFFGTLKMSSDRVQATEVVNRENLKGYFVGDGNYFLHVRGDEYEGMFPYLNWKKLPGVTNFQTKDPVKALGYAGFRNKGNFTGGAVSGNNGVTAFKLNRDSLTANKAYFYYKGNLICMGSAIASELNLPVFTTINQAKLNGPVFFHDGSLRELKDSTYHSNIINWAYHDKIGYYNLQPANLTVSSKKQTGSWGDIAFVYDKEEPTTGDVFTMELTHDLSVKGGSYAYVVVPNLDLDAFKAFKPNFVLVENDKKAQVIAGENDEILMIVVYQPTIIKAKSFPVLSFETPGIYILERKKDHWLASISDPTQKQTKASWDIAGKKQLTLLPTSLNQGQTIQVKIPFN